MTDQSKMTIQKAYEILRLDLNASREDAKKAYRKLAKVYHPDKNRMLNTAENFQLIQLAWECIEEATDSEINDFRKAETISRYHQATQQQVPSSHRHQASYRSYLAEIIENLGLIGAGVEQTVADLQHSQFAGAVLIANDPQRTFLGKIGGRYESDSIFNRYGCHGSRYAAYSIWNKYGLYGSAYSQYSPFNARGFSPPSIVKNNMVIGHLSVNDALKVRGYNIVNPDELMSAYGISMS